MNFIKRIINSFAWQMGKFLFFVALIALIIFLKGTKVLALESSQFGDSISTIVIDSLTSTNSYTYEEYNSDIIKDKVFNWSNEHFFDNTYTQVEFFSHYNYVVMAYNSTTIRVFVQNYDLIMDYQGLTPIESEDIKFYFANMTYQYTEGLYSQYRGGVSVIYSYYIDINYNSDTYTISDNNPLLDLEFYSLVTGSKYRSNADSNDRTYLNLNMNLFDSYNNNFAWIQNWYTTLNTKTLWNQVSGSTPSKSSYYYNSPIEFPTLEYVSSGATPDDNGGDPEEGGTDLSGVEDKIDETNTILGGIGESVIKIGESIGEGLNDLIQGILDVLNDIYTSVTSFFSSFFSDLLNLLKSFFIPEDLDILIELKETLEEKLGFIITIPEMLIQFLIDLINVEWEKVESITFPAVEIAGFYFWKEQVIDITPIINVIEPYKFYTNLACVIMMVSGIIKYYYSFFDGSGGE